MGHYDGINKEVLRGSIHDLKQDFEESLWLLTDLGHRLDEFLTLVRKTIPKTFPQLAEDVVAAVQLLLGDTDKLKRECEVSSKLCDTADSQKDLEQQTYKKYELSARIRAIYGRAAGVFISTDWQSPSFLHSVYPLAGSQIGQIVHTINDYKRDIHWDAQHFEDAYKREYIDGLVKLPINVYATSSGMSALTTIMNYLAGEKLADGSILIGERTYFEAKDLLHRLFGTRIVEFDEFDLPSAARLIRELQPVVVWLDSLTNTEYIAIPDIPSILTAVAASGRNPTTVVIDNTGLSVTYQPVRHAIVKPKNVNLIVSESLNKYHQFGQDRTTGGIIWGVGGESGKISEYRVHTGTNIPDVCVRMLPTPNRKRLQRRLDRLERNASFLATQLDTIIRSSGREDAVEVVYPNLPAYKGFPWTRALPFHGSYFTLKFNDPYRRISFYKQFVDKVIRRAKSEQLPLVSGSSFGMDITRIYLTAVRATVATPFLRVAVGTEHQADMNRIAKVLGEVITASSA